MSERSRGSITSQNASPSPPHCERTNCAARPVMVRLLKDLISGLITSTRILMARISTAAASSRHLRSCSVGAIARRRLCCGCSPRFATGCESAPKVEARFAHGPHAFSYSCRASVAISPSSVAASPSAG